MTEPRHIGRVVAIPLAYGELLAPIRTRVDEVATPHSVLEVAMDLAPGHLGKILGPAEVKRIGWETMWRILDTLGLRLVLVEHLDVAATIDEIGDDYRKRAVKPSSQGKLRKVLSEAIMRASMQAMGARGGSKTKRFGISKKALQQKQIHAANSRWKKYRRAKATKQHVGTPGDIGR